MSLNQELKGKEYQPVEFTVELDQVRQFDDAIGEDNPAFRESFAPPTFVTKMQIMTSGQVVLDQELGLNYALVVHGEQEYEYARPVRIGEDLTAVPRIADIYAKGPNEYLVIEADVKDAAGETVVLARTTLLSRGTAGGG
jgi:hypothetical protein